MWHAKARDGYGRLSTEATENAQEIANTLITYYGWTLEAVAGALGNMQFEVGLNPWRWQGNNILTQTQARTSGTSNGYGLIGWTPARKYQFNNATWNGVVLFPNYDQESYPGYGPNWSDVPGNVNDGQAQTLLIGEGIARHNTNLYLQRSGHVSSSTYITLTDVNYAASEWWWCVEFSEHSSSIPTRQEYARELYAWLVDHGYTPSPGSMPIWLMAKIAQLFQNRNI